MAKNRINRINEEIQRILSGLIRNMKDPRVATMVSVTGVETTGDLRYAKVFISTLNKEEEKSVMKALRSAAGYLRRELGAEIQLRYVPELIFEADDSIKRGMDITKLIKDLETGER